jgi:hypothetical protein
MIEPLTLSDSFDELLKRVPHRQSITVRTANAVWNATNEREFDTITIGLVCKKTSRDYLRMGNIGRTTVDYLEEILEMNGFHLADGPRSLRMERRKQDMINRHKTCPTCGHRLRKMEPLTK